MSISHAFLPSRSLHLNGEPKVADAFTDGKPSSVASRSLLECNLNAFFHVHACVSVSIHINVSLPGCFHRAAKWVREKAREVWDGEVW